MGANQPPARGPGRPRTSQNPGTARGTLASWLCDVAERHPRLLNGTIAAHAGTTEATVGRALRGETLASDAIVAAVVELGAATTQERNEYRQWVAKLSAIDARQGKKTDVSVPPPPWTVDQATTGPPERQRARRRFLAVSVAVGLIAAAAGVAVTVAITQIHASPSLRAEQVANKHGAPTFADPLGGTGETGPTIPAFTFVDVSCKLYSPIFPSTQPDGYWYRIESPPWDGRFYAVANVFANGDPPGSTTATNTDRSVPDC